MYALPHRLSDVTGSWKMKMVTGSCLACSGCFSQAAGDEIAAQLITTSTGPKLSNGSCRPSPVLKSACKHCFASLDSLRFLRLKEEIIHLLHSHFCVILSSKLSSLMLKDKAARLTQK